MKLKNVLNLTAIAAVLILCLTVVAQAENFQTHHLYGALAKGQLKPTGHLPSGEVMQLDVMLPIRDQAGLNDFLAKVYDPSSSTFHQFLKPAQFNDRFGPTQENYDATVQYLAEHGLTVMPGTKGRMHIVVSGPVSAVETAFHVQMLTYQHPTENRTFFAPDREPTTDLPFALWHLSGIDNYELPKPQVVTNGLRTGKVAKGTATGSGPQYSFLGSDMRAAYYGIGYEEGYLTGEGQDMALVEFYGTNLMDLATYYRNVDQELEVEPGIYSTDGTTLACVYTRYDHWCDDTEQTLDMTQALGMAPELNSLTLYVGSSWSAILNTLADPPEELNFPYTISASWLGGSGADQETLNPVFEEFAADGQSYFNAAGDWSEWGKFDCGSSVCPYQPATNAWVTAVGGTDLTTTGPGGDYLAESAWEDGGGGIAPDGGGTGPDSVAIPAWQQYPDVITEANGGSTTLRNGPDVSANANFTYYVCADLSACTYNEYGGTSFASPLWAAYIALLNEASEECNDGPAPQGFINPEIYYWNSLSLSTEYWSGLYAEYLFHDVTTGSQYLGYSAVPGYDLATGWGSPNYGFIDWYYYCDDARKSKHMPPALTKK